MRTSINFHTTFRSATKAGVGFRPRISTPAPDAQNATLLCQLGMTRRTRAPFRNPNGTAHDCGMLVRQASPRLTAPDPMGERGALKMGLCADPSERSEHLRQTARLPQPNVKPASPKQALRPPLARASPWRHRAHPTNTPCARPHHPTNTAKHDFAPAPHPVRFTPIRPPAAPLFTPTKDRPKSHACSASGTALTYTGKNF